ncbi:MAG: helix-turn-helix domain-containing protein [Steroidobacteraceae bacterium]
MDAQTASRPSSQLNLQSVAESQRADTWSRAARSFFPGLKIRDLEGMPNVGSMEGREFGLGSVWTVLSPAVEVTYRPEREGGEPRQSFTVLLQLQGTMAATQEQRHCQLHAGDLCLLDEQWPFRLDVHDRFSHFMLLRMPRRMIVDRYPDISDDTASVIYANDPGATLLRKMLQQVLDIAPFLNDGQGDVAFASVVNLLGILRESDARRDRSLGWRAHAAIALIDARLADTALTANGVAEAQGIGRRHLDEIMQRNTGLSLTAQIWRRRLEKAATDLRSRRCAAKSITQIAFDAGFDDAAHFTRAFRKRYQCTPREWRREDGPGMIRNSKLPEGA